jgi:hypothetical protein
MYFEVVFLTSPPLHLSHVSYLLRLFIYVSIHLSIHSFIRTRIPVSFVLFCLCPHSDSMFPGFRVGATATKDLSKEELYLAVPHEAIIDSGKADRDMQFGKLLFDLKRQFHRRYDFHELLLYLIHQCFVLGSDSKYWLYLRLLPSPAELDRPLL